MVSPRGHRTERGRSSLLYRDLTPGLVLTEGRGARRTAVSESIHGGSPFNARSEERESSSPRISCRRERRGGGRARGSSATHRPGRRRTAGRRGRQRARYLGNVARPAPSSPYLLPEQQDRRGARVTLALAPFPESRSTRRPPLAIPLASSARASKIVGCRASVASGGGLGDFEVSSFIRKVLGYFFLKRKRAARPRPPRRRTFESIEPAAATLPCRGTPTGCA
jgi:hypothetical protein